MRDRFAFEFADLSSEQRDIVETAISDERYVVGPDDTPPDPSSNSPTSFGTRNKPMVSTNRAKTA